MRASTGFCSDRQSMISAIVEGRSYAARALSAEPLSGDDGNEQVVRFSAVGTQRQFAALQGRVRSCGETVRGRQAVFTAARDPLLTFVGAGGRL